MLRKWLTILYTKIRIKLTFFFNSKKGFNDVNLFREIFEGGNWNAILFWAQEMTHVNCVS